MFYFEIMLSQTHLHNVNLLFWTKILGNMALQYIFIASDSLQMQNNFSASYTPKLRNVGNPDQEQAESVPTWVLVN